MSVESDLMTALTSLNIPIMLDVYTGTASTYITINYNTIPDHFCDDRPDYERVLIQVHLIAPATTDITTTKTSIKTALAAAGYTYPRTINASEADDIQRHIVFETETAVYVGG